MIRWMRFPGADMATTYRKQVVEWASANGYDPARIPRDAWAAYDTTTDEFIVENYVNPRLVDPATDTIPRIKIRRRRVAWMNFEEVCP